MDGKIFIDTYLYIIFTFIFVFIYIFFIFKYIFTNKNAKNSEINYIPSRANTPTKVHIGLPTSEMRKKSWHVGFTHTHTHTHSRTHTSKTWHRAQSGDHDCYFVLHRFIDQQVHWCFHYCYCFILLSFPHSTLINRFHTL